MERKQYPTSNGRLENNPDKQSGDKRPPYKGYLYVTPDQIKMLVAMGKADKAVKLQLAAWKNTDKETGEPMLSVKAEAYLNEEGSAPSTPPPTEDLDDWL